MKYLNTKKGFTLIDLLMSVAIVSLLSSIAVYNTSEAKKKAEDAHMVTESTQVKTAISLFKEEKGRVPFSGAKGIVHQEGNPDGGNDDYQEAMQELVNEGYLPEVPTSPNGTAYGYLATEDERNAVFSANLNNPTRNSSSNSCSGIGSSETEWGSCSNPTTYIAFLGIYTTGYEYGPCSSHEFDPEDQACFDISGYQEIIGDCTCNDNDGVYSNTDSIPDALCNEYFYSQDNTCTTHYPIESDSPENWICNFTSESMPCDGSSNTDFCQCI